MEFSHERKKGEHLPPRYRVDEVIGDLAITKVLEYGSRRGLQKTQWWYEVQCSCGAVEELNQSQLRKRVDCQSCMSDRKSRRHRKQTTPQATALPAGVPDFARMRW